MTTVTGHGSGAASNARSAAQWWDAVGRTLAPQGSAARVALLMCTHTLAAELAGHLVMAGAVGVRVGRVCMLPEGGEVLGVELHLAGERAQVLLLPQRARLPVYRWEHRDLATVEPLTTVTVAGAVDGQWLDLRALATHLLPLIGSDRA